MPDGISAEITEVIGTRTPGFNGWQQEHWLYHCNDGAAFLGRVGATELAAYPDALEALQREGEEYGMTPEQIVDHLASLEKDGDPTAYLFRCRHCGVHLAYSDYS